MKVLAVFSPFKYSFQALVQNHYNGNPPLECFNVYGCDPLQMYNYKEDFNTNLYYLGGLILGYNLIAVILMYLIKK